MALGVLFWGVLVGGFVVLSRSSHVTQAFSSSAMASYLTGHSGLVPIASGGDGLLSGDPVFYQDESGNWQQIGHIDIQQTPEGIHRSIRHYGLQKDIAFQYTYCRNTGSLSEVLQLVLPDERRRAILERLKAAQQQHGQEITAALKPIVEQTIRDSIPVMERGISESFADHRSEFQEIADHYESTVLNGRLIPLVKSEVLPIVRSRGEPLAKDIGMQLWDRASLFRFGWRIVYDKSPLPKKDLTNQEWDRFVEKEAVPIFESHADEMVSVTKAILSDISKNPEVRAEAAEVMDTLMQDTRLHSLLGQVLKEGIAMNPELHEVWRNHWQSPEAQQAMQLASKRLEPLVREIGDEILGTREEGIRPGFARVLRNQILGKDRRWIEATVVAESGSPRGEIDIVSTDEVRPYPLMFLANQSAIVTPTATSVN